MKFDIILPSIGRPSLRDALDSVFAQDYKDWNLYVYEQGSITDLNVYHANGVQAFTYWNDVIVRNDYGAHARNCMISYARNPWIAYIDDDDIWSPNHLSTLRDLLLVNPEATMLHTAGQSFSWKHRSPRSKRLARKLGAINSTDTLTVGMAHTRELFSKTQGWQPCDNHDKLLWQEMLLSGGKPATSDTVTFQFER